MIALELSMKLFGIVLISLLIVASPALAENYSKEIKRVETLGQLMATQDNAAWVASDRFVELSDNGEAVGNIRGWLSYPMGKRYKTVFIAEPEGEPVVVFEAVTRKRKIRSSEMLIDFRPMSDSELLLWTARETVLASVSSIELCEKFLPMNTIIVPVPDDDEGRIYVYLLSSSKTWGEIVLGKHYRFTLSSNGAELLDKRSFTNSCFSIGASKTKDGKLPVGLVATHLNAPHPEEHHVFATLSHNFSVFPKDMTLFVKGTSDTLWKVRNGEIESVQD